MSGLSLGGGLPLGSGAPVPQPTVLAGAGTYAVPAGATSLQIWMRGPGCGGAGSGTAAVGATSAPTTDTTFGAFTAVKGGVPVSVAGGPKVVGASGDYNEDGQKGQDGFQALGPGGIGGGIGGGRSRIAQAGDAANLLSGGGGAGAGTEGTAGNNQGGGGGGGAFLYKLIAGPLAASYSYNVGVGSNGGTAGTNGFAGGRGADGYIQVLANFN